MDFIINFFEGNVYWFMAILPFLGQLGLPIGSVFFMLYAASHANNAPELALLFFITLASEIAGDFFGYWIGKTFREAHWFQKLLTRKSLRFLLNKMKPFFEKNGASTIFLSRFLIIAIGPGVNYLAGLEAYNFKKFSISAILGEIIYCAELLLLGYFFKETFEEIVDFLGNFSALIIVGCLLYFFGKRLFSQKNHPKNKL